MRGSIISFLMRYQPATLLRILQTLSSCARRPQLSRQLPARHNLALKASMPVIPFLSSFFGSSASSQMSFPDQRTPGEWRAVLNQEQFRILREKGTEPAGSGKFDKHYPAEGVYTCAGCAAPLYKANHKFKSGCGWPAYFDSIPGAVTRCHDGSFGLPRTEIVCSNCGGHLGHVFKGEGFPTPTDERHCVNSVSLNFTPEDGGQAAGGDGAKGTE